MYKLINDPITNEEMDFILIPSKNLTFPKNLDNRYYQEYLKWIADGNTPEEAQ